MRTCWLALIMAVMLTACAAPNRRTQTSGVEPTNVPEWQGRISVQVLGDAPSSVSASFWLRGNENQGELDIYSPLGTTVGALQWTPQTVQLSEGGKLRRFKSLAELTEQTTGAALPIDAIFGWLQGRDAQATGWQADLSTLGKGTLSARRNHPLPEVTLRIQLDP